MSGINNELSYNEIQSLVQSITEENVGQEIINNNIISAEPSTPPPQIPSSPHQIPPPLSSPSASSPLSSPSSPSASSPLSSPSAPIIVPYDNDADLYSTDDEESEITDIASETSEELFPVEDLAESKTEEVIQEEKVPDVESAPDAGATISTPISTATASAAIVTATMAAAATQAAATQAAATQAAATQAAATQAAATQAAATQAPECSVCYTELNMGNIVNTTCSHKYCKTCFFRWIKTHPSCPMCRKNLVSYNKWYEENNANVEVSEMTELAENLQRTSIRSLRKMNRYRNKCSEYRHKYENIKRLNDEQITRKISLRRDIDYTRGFLEGMNHDVNKKIKNTLHKQNKHCPFVHGYHAGYFNKKQILEKNKLVSAFRSSFIESEPNSDNDTNTLSTE